MQNLSIRTLISWALLLLLGMIILLGTMAIRSELESVDSLTELNEISAQQANTANLSKTHLMEVRLRLARLSLNNLNGQADKAALALSQAQENLAQADQLIEQLAHLDLSSQSSRRPFVDAIVATYNAVVTPPLRRDIANGDYTAISQYSEVINESFYAFSDAVVQFNRYALERGNQLVANNQHDGQQAALIVAALIALALVLYGVMHVSIRRLVTAPLQRAIHICENIAQGDLTSTIEMRGRNEIGRFYSALNQMQARLEDIIGTLSQSSQGVAASSQEIASGSQDLASRTEQQASALQQTAASMDEISSIVQQNADTATQAETLTVDAAAKAKAGQTEAQRASQMMNELKDASHKVHDIVQVIDSIAFQTNILALNASVEAARAGEQGRGFAVVASEVRSLATKTSNSSKEIRALIEDIAQRIADGAHLALRNGESIGEINTAILRVTDMMQALSMAAKEQESGITQISTAIAQMDSATQENVSLVEETSTASASLEGEANRLAELVGTFKYQGQRVTHALPATPANAKSKAPEPEWAAF